MLCCCCGIIWGSDGCCACLLPFCLKLCWLRRLRWLALTAAFASLVVADEASVVLARGAGDTFFECTCLFDAAAFEGAVPGKGIDIQET